MIIIQSNDLLKKINDSITENSISKLNLELEKEYLITWDKTTHQLSLEQDISKVIYIKNIMFFNISQAKNELLTNTLFERLMSDIDININEEFFDIWKFKQIELGVKNKLNISIYAKPKFDCKQMIEIRLGLESDLDVSIYAKLDFNREQMRQIRFGLEDKLNILVYAKPEFNAEKMEYIRKNLKNSLDISIKDNY